MITINRKRVLETEKTLGGFVRKGGGERSFYYYLQIKINTREGGDG